ncbi:MAG: HAMP domain-containing protein [Pelotomaculum sp.]|uniref:histidine kinase n=1 Tax=Pelotomaculum thermopropionicum (strain DSM 13744 / JCM 10971 / SI) TaxID=370438 RepID=A5D6C8_PELTS|nr:HAMP domain-containing protein [Pelotomaculum sp.]BAF58217.1 hypothetical membrane-associated sensory histidine kinase [Pelotomaculum thermopropionicum SI]
MNSKKSEFFGSLRIQLLSRSLLILALLLMLIGLFQYVLMKEFVYRNKAASIQSQLLSVPRFDWPQLPGIPEDGRVRPPLFFIPEVNLAFVDLEGNFYVLSRGPGDTSPPRLDTGEYLSILGKRPDLRYKVVYDSAGTEQLLVLQPVMARNGKVIGITQAGTLTGPLKELLVRQLLVFLVLSLAAMFFGLLGFLPVIRRTLAPLSNMIDTAGQIDAGNLAKRFPTQQGQVEIDRLAESFNGMLDRLEASFKAERETKEQMRRFIADASHELRTPLTSIHGFLEVLLRGAASQPDQLQKALKSMHSESERLTRLVHDLLLLAKLDRTPQVELAEGLLSTMILDMEPQLRILAGNRELSLQIEPGVVCRYDVNKMKQVILNLFHNAVQHTDPEGGCIRLSLSRVDGGVRLSVQDNGPGIGEEYLPHIFDRFYRIDVSRARKYGGSGLGLAITKAIVDIHGGVISVESKPGEGCTFHIWLPV